MTDSPLPPPSEPLYAAAAEAPTATPKAKITIDGTAVEVADRGTGIAPDDTAKVFDRFYRADNARTRPGSGLGLSIVAQIAEAHGAIVTVRSRSGGGTIARFELPTG
jgi:two-component system sensor histidine kinase MprB